MLGVFAFPALLPDFAREWSLSNTQAGWINGIYFGGYALGVPVLASLTDRVDGRRVYLTMAAVGALASVGFALLAQGFWTALLFRLLAGVGLAGTFIPGLKALVDRTEGLAQTRAVSFYTATFSLGTASSFFVTGELAGMLGWRWAFAAAGLGLLVAMIIVFLVMEPRPRGAVAPPALLDFRPVLRNRAAMAYVLAYASHTWELFAARSWMVAFLAFSLTLQPPGSVHWEPTSVAALTGLVAMWASVGGAELAMRFGGRRVLNVIMGLSAVFGCTIGFLAGLPYPVVAALCMGYMLFVQGDSAILHAGTVRHADVTRRGATLAVQSLLGFGAAFVAPLVVGVVLDLTGGGLSPASWGAGFAVMGLVVALGPLILWLRRDAVGAG